MQNFHRSRLMHLSWEIQRRRKSNRSRSLFAAWAIFQNEDITVYHLVRKHSHQGRPDKLPAHRLTLFAHL